MSGSRGGLLVRRDPDLFTSPRGERSAEGRVSGPARTTTPTASLLDRHALAGPEADDFADLRDLGHGSCAEVAAGQALRLGRDENDAGGEPGEDPSARRRDSSRSGPARSIGLPALTQVPSFRAFPHQYCSWPVPG